MPTDVDPEVDDELLAELDKLGISATLKDKGKAADEPKADEQEADAEPEAPIAGKDPESTVRRSRREGTKAERVDWTTSPEFREYQSKKDREVADATRRAEEAERKHEQILADQTAIQQTMLEQRLDQTVDPGERARLSHQITAIQYQQERAWGQHFDKQLRDRGVDPATWDFKKYRAMGQPGAVLFERDLAQHEANKLRKELEETKKITSPATVAELVKKAVAQALHAQGIDAVDVAVPEGKAGSGDWETDRDKLQSGEMSPAAFKKKYKGS